MDCPTRGIPPARRAGPDACRPVPGDDPLPGAYELHLPSDGVTIWYTVTPYEGQEIIGIQHVRLDT
jgi:hypothetical protein